MDKILSLLSNKELEAKLNGCMDADKVKALAREYGTELTDEETQQAIDLLEVRLSDEELSNVTGGANQVICCAFCGLPLNQCKCFKS
jgi:hypothetical protein